MNWIEVNGTSLRYELSGNGKTTLVLVHEMGGTLDSWDQVLPALNNTRRVLRCDTRGAGLSEKIHGKVTFDDMADDLAALLDATGIGGKVALAGTADGGRSLSCVQEITSVGQAMRGSSSVTVESASMRLIAAKLCGSLASQRARNLRNSSAFWRTSGG